MIVLTGYQGSETSLYQDVSMALQAMQEPEPVTELWLPQFKIETSVATSMLENLTDEGVGPAQQRIQMQLYGAPVSDGSLVLKPSEESVIVNEPFVVAITNSKVSDKLEMPLLVLSVPRSTWKQII